MAIIFHTQTGIWYKKLQAFKVCFSGKLDIFRLAVVLQLLSNIIKWILHWEIFLKGSFKNSLDKILTIFDYLSTSTWKCFTLNLDKNNHFLTTYPPHLVHVVFERPLIELNSIFCTMNLKFNLTIEASLYIDKQGKNCTTFYSVPSWF